MLNPPQSPHAPLEKRAVWLLVLAVAAACSLCYWIGNRQGQHKAEAAAALARSEKSAAEPPRPHHPNFPAKSPPRTVRDLRTLGIKIDPADIDGSLHSIRDMARPQEKMAADRELMAALPEDRWPEVLTNVYLKWDTTERDAALDYIAAGAPERCLSSLLEERHSGESGMLLAAWAGHDLPAALAFFEAHSEKMLELSSKYVRVLAGEYSRTNREAALKWIGTLPDKEKDDAAATWLRLAVEKDVAAAVRLYESGPVHLRGGQQAEVIGRAWAASDPEAAMKWAAALPDEEGLVARHTVIAEWAERDFDAACKAVSTLPADAQGLVLPGLVDGAKTPERLAQVRPFIEALPEGEDRGWAAGLLVNRWSNSDPTAAGTWVDGLPPGPTRDYAIDRFRGPDKSEEFPTYFDRQATIQDPETRQTALKRHVVHWLGKDPEAARAWVKESPKLTPEDREALLKITGK